MFCQSLVQPIGDQPIRGWPVDRTDKTSCTTPMGWNSEASLWQVNVNTGSPEHQVPREPHQNVKSCRQREWEEHTSLSILNSSFAKEKNVAFYCWPPPENTRCLAIWQPGIFQFSALVNDHCWVSKFSAYRMLQSIPFIPHFPSVFVTVIFCLWVLLMIYTANPAQSKYV